MTTGYKLIAGVDEAGRGPLAGPVIAAAVILDPKRPIKGLADSKTLTAEEREALFETIIARSLCYGVGRADVAEIDHHNILRASLIAMARAVSSLSIKPGETWVDGTFCPDIDGPVQVFVKGDEKFPVISAASIVAKVIRDREMQELDKIYPGYGFAQHKGYSTPQHFEALGRLGACPIHRRSFSPVREALERASENLL